MIEDNLRFIKMHMPLKEGFSWKGNRYLPTGPYQPKYNFTIDNNIDDWDFYYDNFSPHSPIGVSTIQTSGVLKKLMNLLMYQSPAPAPMLTG